MEVIAKQRRPLVIMATGFLAVALLVVAMMAMNPLQSEGYGSNPPQLTGVTIDTGAVYTRDSTVTVDISALNYGSTNDSSQITHVALSNDGVFNSTSGAEKWRTFPASGSIAWSLGTLTEGQTKTVYVKVKDVSDDSSATVTDSIIVDKTAIQTKITSPKFSTDVPLAGVPTTNYVVAWDFYRRGDTSGISTWEIQTRDSGTTTWGAATTVAGGTQAQSVTGVAGQTLYYRVRANDVAGNVGSWSAATGTTVPRGVVAAVTGGLAGSQVSGSLTATCTATYALGTAAWCTDHGTSADAWITADAQSGKEYSVILGYGPKGGIAKVYVGTKLVKTLNTFGPGAVGGQPIYENVVVAKYPSAASRVVKVKHEVGTALTGTTWSNVFVSGFGVRN